MTLDALGRKLEYHGKDLYAENLSITHRLGFCRTNPEDESPQKPAIGPSIQSGFPINIIREKYLWQFSRLPSEPAWKMTVEVDGYPFRRGDPTQYGKGSSGPFNF